MEWVFAIILICYLSDIESKLKRVLENQDNNEIEKTIGNTNRKIVFNEYLNKEVCIVLKDDIEMSEQHLFYAGEKNKGIITDFDDNWIIFNLKKKKENIKYYIRIKDIESIDEIK